MDDHFDRPIVTTAPGGLFFILETARLGERIHGTGVQAMKATASIQVENDRVIVTEWRFAPGAETGQHVHALDYVVVPLTNGILRLQEPTGVRDVELQVGVSYARLAGVDHNVVNANDFEFRFVEVELK
jgi:quercetin dioxygenase-like cupin family protein